ncbi:MAG: hypothetical protein K6F77_03675 [Lachnospiraceae bacterium]|nr:hypothetical protein [Lachnospiraceae bacterium]
MKKFYSLCLSLLIAFLIVGCSDGEKSAVRKNENSNSVQNALDAGVAEADGEGDVPENAQSSSESDSSVGGNSSEDEGAQDAPVDGDKLQGEDTNRPTPSVDSSEENQDGEDSESKKVDINLTKLSSNMVYSEVFSMMSSPEKFVGKIVKMRGTYTSIYNQEEDVRYHACIVKDAMECCSEGIEFNLTDDYNYPDDYPIEGDEITVLGEFTTYDQDGLTYATLKNARLIK